MPDTTSTPVRADHAVGIETAKNIAGGMIQTIITRWNQTLLIILMQQLHRRFRMVLHELLHHGNGRISGTVIDDNHLMRHHGRRVALSRQSLIRSCSFQAGMTIETFSMVSRIGSSPYTVPVYNKEP